MKCYNHNDRDTIGVCNVCERGYCNECQSQYINGMCVVCEKDKLLKSTKKAKIFSILGLFFTTLILILCLILFGEYLKYHNKLFILFLIIFWTSILSVIGGGIYFLFFKKYDHVL